MVEEGRDENRKDRWGSSTWAHTSLHSEHTHPPKSPFHIPSPRRRWSTVCTCLSVFSWSSFKWITQHVLSFSYSEGGNCCYIHQESLLVNPRTLRQVKLQQTKINLNSLLSSLLGSVFPKKHQHTLIACRAHEGKADKVARPLCQLQSLGTDAPTVI